MESKCRHCKIGTYEHQVTRYNPSNGSAIGIDRCIVKEIEDLWFSGIHTTGSCCGHGIIPGMVNVIEADMDKMLALGYIGGRNMYGAPTYALRTQCGTMGVTFDDIRYPEHLGPLADQPIAILLEGLALIEVALVTGNIRLALRFERSLATALQPYFKEVSEKYGK
ncbi:hypothetical protein SDC9_195601 [bioreactor metagenome]|uniref:Uncharacterized protein n=1 Tax=bioreactor metagenome TaxID=1076179 RepID=A0A645I9H9_9ZZZZ